MRLCAETLHPETCIRIDGESLEIAHLVSVAKYGVRAELDKKPEIVKRVEESVEMLRRHLKRGDLVYGKPILHPTQPSTDFRPRSKHGLRRQC